MGPWCSYHSRTPCLRQPQAWVPPGLDTPPAWVPPGLGYPRAWVPPGLGTPGLGYPRALVPRAWVPLGLGTPGLGAFKSEDRWTPTNCTSEPSYYLIYERGLLRLAQTNDPHFVHTVNYSLLGARLSKLSSRSKKYTKNQRHFLLAHRDLIFIELI